MMLQNVEKRTREMVKVVTGSILYVLARKGWDIMWHKGSQGGTKFMMLRE